MSGQSLFHLGIALIFVGFAIAFIAAILVVLASAKGEAEAKGGGAVIIGPLPIIFGTNKESVKILLILSIILIAFLLVAMVFSRYVLGWR